jgi:ATP-dependent DNA helicase RecQ
LTKARTFISSFDRENLRVSVLEKKQAFAKLLNLLEKYRNESVIIYCFSRKDTEMLAENLKLNKYKVCAYHAGLDARERTRAQDLFIKDEVNIITATIAFGMGIDKPDVRLVVHYTYPKTLEGYYQEIGRAGRDGLPSECIMFYTYADTRKHEFFINQMEDSLLRTRAREKLSEVLNYAELLTCRKRYLLKYFGEEMVGDGCGSCDVCLADKEKFDVTIPAQKILSAVVRTQNRFGKNYVIDVLLGKKNQKVLRNKHDQLSVFGIAREHTDSELGQIINQLINLGDLTKSDGEYPTLSISKKGLDFLQSDTKLEIPKLKEDLPGSSPVKPGELDYNRELFDELRILRKKLADEANVPPFVIFGDTALREMAYYFPQDKSGFARISGVGARKLEQLGEIFLDAINGYAEKNNIASIAIPDKKAGKAAVRIKMRQPEFYTKTRELLLKKIPLERIAKNQEIQPSTVINHIEKLIDAGEKLDLDYLKLPKEKYEIIKAAFDECSDEKLKPVFEYLEGKYSYDELKLVRVLMRN